MQGKIGASLSNIQPHWPALIILTAFLLLAGGYALATPPFEAGDESRHYAVVKYMATTGRLIVQNDPQNTDLQHHWSHEGNQPPLYYALAAALAAPIDKAGWQETFWYNPHTTIGDPLRPDNKNITIHPATEGWPWRGPILALYLARFLSIAMATVTVGACYAIALYLFKGRRWLATGAMSITAFNPMFLFISASVNNDNAVIMFITLALWLMVHLAQGGKQNGQVPHRLARATALLGVLLGLGALSKLYAIGLLPIAGALLCWLAYQSEAADSPDSPRALLARSQFWRKALVWNGLMLLLFVAVAGWFYLRNGVLYDGDIFALQVMRDTAGQREQAPTLATLRAEFKGFRIAYWALFGGVNILVADWIYNLLDLFWLAALVGLVIFVGLAALTWLGRKPPGPRLRAIHTPTFILLFAWCLVMVAGFIVWNLTQPAGQGRLLYPAIAAISALTLLGLTWWQPNSGQTVSAILVAGALFLFAVAAPIFYIAPAYAKAPILSEADLPADLQRLDLIHDDALRLIGYRLHTPVVHPAETLSLTLYWQLLQPVELNYSIFVHVLGRQRQLIAQRDTYPAGGDWPTTLLNAGDILADTYTITIPPYTEQEHAPTRLTIAAGIYDFFEPGRPGRPVVDTAGQAAEHLIATARLIPWQWPQITPAEPTVNFFDKATLLRYEIAPDQQHVTLNWQATGLFESDYTVFVQAWDTETGSYVAGFDGPPVAGDYPTSLWRPGETIIDRHPLDLSQLPAGRYTLLAGLYNPATGERLPAFTADGPLPDYAVKLGQIEVAP